MERVLHTYFRSSSAYRVRIALNLKGLEAKHVPIHLTRGGGEQFTAEYLKLNPLALVPVLAEGDLRLSQSLAILESLDERYPLPPLLPASIEDRARARQLASTIACDVHPLNSTPHIPRVSWTPNEPLARAFIRALCRSGKRRRSRSWSYRPSCHPRTNSTLDQTSSTP